MMRSTCFIFCEKTNGLWFAKPMNAFSPPNDSTLTSNLLLIFLTFLFASFSLLFVCICHSDAWRLSQSLPHNNATISDSVKRRKKRYECDSSQPFSFPIFALMELNANEKKIKKLKTFSDVWALTAVDTEPKLSWAYSFSITFPFYLLHSRQKWILTSLQTL